MPVYEYECDKCAVRFEVKRGFHETGGNVCPECGGEGRQIFFATPLHFKGSGFYCTENRKGKDTEAEAMKTAGEVAAKAPSADAAKPAVKPAAAGAETKKAPDKKEPA
jgi:putative FmdB family regulatory protein